jgi:hypothetical protein
MYLPAPLMSSTSTVSPSVPCRKVSPSASQNVGGFHGKLWPSGSSLTASRPSVVMVEPSGARMTKEGMPWTLYFFESLFLRSRASNGSASHGCSP